MSGVFLLLQNVTAVFAAEGPPTPIAASRWSPGPVDGARPAHACQACPARVRSNPCRGSILWRIPGATLHGVTIPGKCSRSQPLGGRKPAR